MRKFSESHGETQWETKFWWENFQKIKKCQVFLSYNLKLVTFVLFHVILHFNGFLLNDIIFFIITYYVRSWFCLIWNFWWVISTYFCTWYFHTWVLIKPPRRRPSRGWEPYGRRRTKALVWTYAVPFLVPHVTLLTVAPLATFKRAHWIWIFTRGGTRDSARLVNFALRTLFPCEKFWKLYVTEFPLLLKIINYKASEGEPRARLGLNIPPGFKQVSSSLLILMHWRPGQHGRKPSPHRCPFLRHERRWTGSGTRASISSWLGPESKIYHFS